MNDTPDTKDIRNSSVITSAEHDGLTEEELRIFNSILEGEDKPAPRRATPTKTPKLTTAFWKKTKNISASINKSAISIRLDTDVLDWFKRQDGRYQSRINAVLRAYVDAQKKPR